jgi:hypothetical protein
LRSENVYAQCSPSGKPPPHGQTFDWSHIDLSSALMYFDGIVVA